MSIIELLEKMEELSTEMKEKDIKIDIESLSNQLDSLTEDLEAAIMNKVEELDSRIYKLQYEEF